MSRATPSGRTRVAAAGKTDVGRRRKHNEDSILLKPELRLFIVADGMGGHNAGEVASALAARSVENFFAATDADELPTEFASQDQHLSVDARRLVGAVRKAAAEGKLPPEIQNELVCSVCLHRLHRYREWLEERVENDEQPVRKQLAQRLGLALYKCLAAQYAQTAVYKRPSDDLDFWRDIAHGGDPKTF